MHSSIKTGFTLILDKEFLKADSSEILTSSATASFAR